MRTHSFFDQLLFVNAAGATKLELANALIVSARIAAGAKLGDIHSVYPELVKIVVANEHERVLAAYNSAARVNKFVAARREVFSSDAVQPEKIRELLLQYMGSDNVLVGIHLNWLLTAVLLNSPSNESCRFWAGTAIPELREGAKRIGKKSVRRLYQRASARRIRSAMASTPHRLRALQGLGAGPYLGGILHRRALANRRAPSAGQARLTRRSPYQVSIRGLIRRRSA